VNFAYSTTTLVAAGEAGRSGLKNCQAEARFSLCLPD